MSSDRGSQFTSAIWSHIAQLLETQIHCAATLNPQGNRLMWRFHCCALSSAYRTHIRKLTIALNNVHTQASAWSAMEMQCKTLSVPYTSIIIYQWCCGGGGMLGDAILL